jgi:hypothetical protein
VPAPPADVLLDGTLRLPTRMLNWAERKGITTLGQLAHIAPEELLAERNLGRLTVARTRRVIEARLGAAWEDLAALSGAAEHAAPNDLAGRSTSQLLASRRLGTLRRVVESVAAFQVRAEERRRLADAGLLESWQTMLHELDDVPRLVLTLRAGLGGRAETLRAIGDRLGVSREAVRQTEERAIEELRREGTWLGALRARADAALLGGAVPLSALAEDAWWAGIAALPDALDYFGERLLEGELHVVLVDDEAYVARCTQRTLDEAWKRLRESAEQVPLPAPWEAFTALLDPVRERISAPLAGALFEQLAPLLHVEATTGGRVIAVGDTCAAAACAVLRASPVPVHIDELRARVGRGQMPDEALWLGRGLIGLSQHFPDFATWMARLVPAAIRVMERDGPKRQWRADELREALREEAGLPDWLTEWHLASLLRRSGNVRYLGRNRVALLDVPGLEERVQFRAGLLRILRERGRAMTRAELVGELHRKTGVKELRILQYLAHPEFLRVDADRYGLVERDLPGGLEALAKATDHVASLLERRQRGLGVRPICDQVKRLGRLHARWTPELCGCLLRRDARFRVAMSGAVGLSSWESVRLPTRVELVRQCLEAAGGRVRVEAVQRQIEADYGRAPNRVQIGGMANLLGAALWGDWLEQGPL